jgi:hypothetical protein
MLFAALLSLKEVHLCFLSWLNSTKAIRRGKNELWRKKCVSGNIENIIPLLY